MNTTSSLPAPPSSLPPHPPPPRSRDPTGRPPPIPDMERGRPRRSPSYSRPYPGPGGPGGRSSRSPLPPNPSLRPRSRSRSPPGAHYPPYAGRYRPGPPDGGLPPGMRDTYQPSYPPYPPYPRSRSRSRSPRPYMNHRRSRSRSRSPGFYGHPHGPPYGYRGNGPRRSPSPYHNRIRRNSFSPRRGPGPYSRGDRDRDRDRDRDWDRDRERDRDMDRNRDRDRETDPDKLEGLIRFESWVGWFRNRWPAQAKEEEEAHPNAKLEAQPVVGLPRLYLKYKEGYKMRQLWSLYLVHKNQGWFKDRYSPDTTFVNMRIETTKRGKIPTVNKYLGELKEGVWDEVCYEATREKEGRKLPNGLNLWGPGVPQASDRDVIEITHPPHQLFVKTLHSNQTRESLEATFRLVGGYQYLALSDPSPKKQYARVGWIQFAPTTNMDYALTTLNKVKIGDFQLNMVKNSEPFIGRARYTPSLSCTLDRMRHDATQAKAMAVKLEDDLYLEPVKDAVEEDQDGMDEIKPADTILTQTHRFASDQRGSSIVQEKIEQLKKEMGLDKGEDELSPDQLNESARIELDHWLSYLRNALHTCYYCVAPTDYAEELYRKCIRHLRSSTDLQNENTANGGDVTMEDDSNRAGGPRHGAKRKAHDRNTKADVWAEKRWSDNVDHKIKLIILPRDKIDLEEYGAKQKEDYPPYKRLIESYISIDDPKKCRCTLCNKPFKASEFVARHIVSRHPELINELPNPAEFEERVNKDYPMFNNFALDPQHLPPIMTYPASVDQRMPHMAPDMLPTMHPVRRNDTYRPDDHGRDHPDSARKPNLAHRIGGYISGGPAGLPDLPLGPPPKIKEDPRARRGKVSYVDLDASAGKVKAEPADGGLPW